MAQAKAKEIIDKLKSKIDTAEDIRVDCIKEKYKEHLPTYVKKRGSRHVEASKTQPIADKTFKLNLSRPQSRISYMHRSFLQSSKPGRILRRILKANTYFPNRRQHI